MSALLLLAHAWAGEVHFGPKGLVVSEGEVHELSLGLSFQPRLTTTLSGDPEATDEEARSDEGLRIRRMLLTAQGHVTEDIDFRFRVNFANQLTLTDGDGKSQQVLKPVLDDAQIVYKVARPLGVAFGQWKVPFSLSQAMSDTSLLFPDRPIALDGFRYGDLKVEGFSWGRDAGVAALTRLAEGKVELGGGAFQGDGANAWPGDEGLLYAGRLAVAPLGEMKLDEVDQQRGPARFALGLSAAHNSHPVYDDAGAAQDPDRQRRLGAELRLSARGLSVQAEGFTGRVEVEGAEPVESLGAYAQVGYCLEGGLAPGLRWTQLDPAREAEGDRLTQWEGVLNWYLPNGEGGTLGHKAQLQLAWTTTTLQEADHPLSHQIQLASHLGF
jgi:Phosphate-selective porin O and P